MMNRPLVMIDGSLALPMLRPFNDVPPPFGAYGRAVKAAIKKTARQIANAEQNRRFPLGEKHIFLCQTPPPREHNGHLDAALAEARRYLSMDAVCYRSSRLDYVLGAAIFVGCGIAFCWLLTTCSAPDIEATKSGMGRVVVSSRIGKVTASSRPPVSPVPVSSIVPAETATSMPEKPGTTVLPPLDHIGNRLPQSVDSPSADQLTMNPPVVQKDAALSPQKARTRAHVGRMTEANVRARVALNGLAHPAMHPSVSVQPEWKDQPSRDGDASQQGEWLAWAARNHQVPVEVYSAPSDEHWNDHMTQRRITDDPAAFHVARGAN